MRCFFAGLFMAFLLLCVTEKVRGEGKLFYVSLYVHIPSKLLFTSLKYKTWTN